MFEKMNFPGEFEETTKSFTDMANPHGQIHFHIDTNT